MNIITPDNQPTANEEAFGLQLTGPDLIRISRGMTVARQIAAKHLNKTGEMYGFDSETYDRQATEFLAFQAIEAELRGVTYAEQSRQRKCDSLLPEGNGSTKLHTCYLPYNHLGKHENYLATRVW